MKKIYTKIVLFSFILIQIEIQFNPINNINNATKNTLKSWLSLKFVLNFNYININLVVVLF